jgi:hypothetical protein
MLATTLITVGKIICGSNHDEAPSPLTAPRGSHLTRDWVLRY